MLKTWQNTSMEDNPMEEDLNVGQIQSTIDLLGRGPKGKATSIEDNLIEDDLKDGNQQR